MRGAEKFVSLSVCRRPLLATRPLSVEYNYLGTDAIDLFHGWLNYQIEHHMWPNLSMHSCRKAAAQVQDIHTHLIHILLRISNVILRSTIL